MKNKDYSYLCGIEKMPNNTYVFYVKGINGKFLLCSNQYSKKSYAKYRAIAFIKNTKGIKSYGL